MKRQDRPTRDRPATRIGRGPMATERLLLEDVDEIIDALGERSLGRPVVIVVPSRALRVHVLARLLAHHGRALAGVECQTHYRLASRILEVETGHRAGGVDLSPLIARRMARDEPALARALAHLDDGYRAVLPAVSDLLDAGLDPAHGEALEEVLEQEGPGVAGRGDLARAHAAVRVAVRTAAAMLDLGLERSSTILARAAETITLTGTAPWSAVLVYGYSDATGVATDFLLALLEACGGRVYLDRPPDPARPAAPDSGVRYSRRFSERVIAIAPPSGEVADAEGPALEMYRAVGSDAEVREAARRIRALIDSGVDAERIGIVARNLEPYRRAVRLQLHRLALPFSGIGATGSQTPAGHRAAAILELVRDGGRTPFERWLEARSTGTLPAEGFDLRLAFHTLGIGRLADAATADVDALLRTGILELPFVSQLTLERRRESPDTLDGDGDLRPKRRRRQIPRTALDDEISRCGRALDILSRRDPQPVAGHLRDLETLLGGELAAGASDDLVATLLERASRALGSLPADFTLDHQEVVELLRTAWSPVGETHLGGAGGGVQVLDVTEARSGTFEHLFILGMNRGRFPRVVHPDPMLSDSLRRVLGRSGHGVLPDLPPKLDGRDEERFLFAQLLSASPRVTLSWQDVDDDGNFLAPSTFVERLRWSASGGRTSATEPPRIEGILAGAGAAPGELRPALEAAVRAGLAAQGDRTPFRDALEIALRESSEWGAGDREPAALARTRTRILDELDPARHTAGGSQIFGRLGPYLGLIGSPEAMEDPRSAPEIWVTTLESLVRCPWQTMLQRVLGIEPSPDPVGELPTIEQRLVGNLVHEVLADIVRCAVGTPPKNLDEASRRPGVEISWPSDDDIALRLDRAARGVLEREGIALPGLERVLARLAAPFLDAAREADWPAGTSRRSIVAAELRCRTTGMLDPAAVAFRVDRVDRDADGLVFTDYKTGRSPFGVSGRSLQPSHLLNAIAAGTALQAMAYALAPADGTGHGRYLFVHPDIDDSKGREAVVASTDDDAARAFRSAGGALLDLWRLGAFFPRLVEPNKNEEPDACSHCEVAEACLRGDSGARSRLRVWAERSADDRESDTWPAHGAALAVWSLPTARGASR